MDTQKGNAKYEQMWQDIEIVLLMTLCVASVIVLANVLFF